MQRQAEAGIFSEMHHFIWSTIFCSAEDSSALISDTSVLRTSPSTSLDKADENGKDRTSVYYESKTKYHSLKSI